MSGPIQTTLGQRSLEVLIEVPRGSFVKRDARGSFEFLSPLPCPFNYGSVPALLAADRDTRDAVVMGPRLSAGSRVSCQVQALIVFLDAGVQDDKLICAARPLDPAEAQRVLRFFQLYARCKRLMNLMAGRRGPTRCLGWGDAARSLADTATR